MNKLGEKVMLKIFGAFGQRICAVRSSKSQT